MVWCSSVGCELPLVVIACGVKFMSGLLVLCGIAVQPEGLRVTMPRFMVV